MRFATRSVGACLLLMGCSTGGPVVETGPRSDGSVVASSEEGSKPRAATAATLGIPPGHLPPPGQCRVWIPGEPPGHQRPAGSCEVVERQVPPGGWLVYRPSKSRRQVKVLVYERTRSRVVLIRLFDAATGRMLRETAPQSP